MLLYIIDKNFNTIANISEYSYAAYTEEYNALGNFEIHTILDENASLIKERGYYILLEKDVCGILQAIEPSVNEETQDKTLILKGYLATELLTRRCVPKSTSFSGSVVGFAAKIMNENCISPQDSSRQLPIVLNENMPEDNSSAQRQMTGGSVEENFVELFGSVGMGHSLTPRLSTRSLIGFKFNALKGIHREINNGENSPVVFSTDLRNILSGAYSYNSQDYKNTAYVAGEGEGAERTLRVVNDSNSGVDRYELYVDARDIQSTDEDGNTLTTEEYNTALDNRGIEYLKNYLISETYEATISQTDDKFIYKRDFFLGDIVTVQDETLGLSLDVRITAVQVSSMGYETRYDLTFGEAKISTVNKLKRKGVI